MANGEVEAPELVQQADEARMRDGAREPGKQPARAVASGLLRPFRVRNFRLLFGGQTVSIIGDALYMVALPWLILTTGGSAQELGIVLAAYGIPRAGSMLVGGWLSDRLRPRRLMLIADMVRMVLVGILAALAFMGHPAFWQLCAIAVPLGAFGGAFMPAYMSILPDTLSTEDMQAGNGLMMSSLQGANLVGSASAGVIVAAFTAGAGLAIDAATFLVSAVSLALMRTVGRTQLTTSGEQGKGAGQENPSASTQEQGAQVAVQSFWRFLLTSRLIQVFLLMFLVIGLFSGGLIEVALPTLVHGPLHGSSSSFGFIMAAWGAGSLVGSICAGMLGKLTHKGLTILLAGLIVAAAIGLVPTWGVIGAIVCMLIGGLASSNINVLLFTTIHLVIPRHLMGRVMGLLMFSSFGLYPLSVALAGVLSTRFGPAILFPFGGLLLGLVMVFGMTQRVLREL
jgi:MFS family permease